MSSRRFVRFLLALAVALLVLTGLQPAASASTSRSLGIAVTPAATASGSVVTFSGRLTRSPKGTLVRLQRRSGSAWVAAGATRTTTSTGRYAVRVTLPTPVAIYSFRAVAPRKGSLATATSKTVRVAALAKRFVSLTPSPKTVTAGTSTTMTGLVRPFVRGAGVLLQRWTGSSWATVATAPLNSNGIYSRAVAVSRTSTYRAVVARSGMTAAGSSTPVTVTATPPEPQVPPAPVIATTSLPQATEGSSYDVTLATTSPASGTWSASPLPAGLSLDEHTGVISGTPTAPGTTHVVVGFTEIGNPTAATPKTLDLVVAPRPAPVITTAELPDGKVWSKYAAQLAVAGDPAGTWSISGKPAWMSFSTTTGAIGGTPLLPGDYKITVGFTETGNPTPAAPVTLTVHVAGL
ncbi:MAG: putative Ig domain-containing protein [Nocardioidaceae bacterium]|nr:putative Ig domain-containing protein [Nocardioidaceae bacterium]